MNDEDAINIDNRLILKANFSNQMKLYSDDDEIYVN
jgi:hypothetical protein